MSVDYDVPTLDKGPSNSVPEEVDDSSVERSLSDSEDTREKED